MTSLNKNTYQVGGPCAVPGEFPVNSPHKSQWRGALCFFNLRLNKRLSKQLRQWWYWTSSRHYDVTTMFTIMSWWWPSSVSMLQVYCHLTSDQSAHLLQPSTHPCYHRRCVATRGLTWPSRCALQPSETAPKLPYKTMRHKIPKSRAALPGLSLWGVCTLFPGSNSRSKCAVCLDL